MHRQLKDFWILIVILILALCSLRHFAQKIIHRNLAIYLKNFNVVIQLKETNKYIFRKIM
jgi:hypothetical protein